MTYSGGSYLVSNSEVQTFKDCPRRWWLAWHRGLVPKHISPIGPRSTGTRIHAALAVYYEPGVRKNALAELYAVQQEDLRLLAVSVEDDDEERVTTNIEDLTKIQADFDLERAMVEGYLDWVNETGVDQDIEVIATETYVEVPFPTAGDDIKLIGKLDAKVINTQTGDQTFIDHKTVGSLNDPTLGLNQQVLHYMVIDWLCNSDEKPIVGAMYNMLRKSKRTDRAKPPFYMRHVVNHNQHEVAAYIHQLTGVIALMRRAMLHLSMDELAHQAIVPSRPSRDCSWKCDFFKICRMFDDGSRVDDAITDLYEQRNPLDYYGDALGRIDGN